ncbi:MAG: class I SAM-dependent methyltransferase [Pseudomonadota bacterium]
MTEQTQDEYWNGENGEKWARGADHLDAMLAPFLAPVLERVAQHNPKTILDIGCGAGALTLACAKQHRDAVVTGVDLSQQLLRVARERASAQSSGAVFFKADAMRFNAGDKVHAMVSRFGIMFFSDPVEAYTVLREKMATGGVFIAVCWQALAKNDWMLVPFKAGIPYFKEDPAAPDPTAPGPFAFADADRTKRIFSDAGWRDVALTPWTGQLTLPGETMADTVEFCINMGPLSSAIRTQGLDAETFKAPIEKALTAASPKKGQCLLGAAAWIVTAYA